MRSPRLSISALAVVVVLVVAACGGGGEFNDAVGVAAPPGTEVVAPVTGGGAAPTTVAVGAPAAFCQDLERLQTLLPLLLLTTGETTTLRQLQALLARIEADAPADIRPDVTVVRQTEDQLIKDLTANPPDL